jgi:hypothetical protein
MEPDPTITITCDHLVVFSDDANNPTPAKAAEIVVIPSPSPAEPTFPDLTSLPPPEPSLGPED